MTDYGDFCREHKQFKKDVKKHFGIPCPQCVEKLPKANPTILLPHHRCKIHNYLDNRGWQQVALDLQYQFMQTYDAMVAVTECLEGWIEIQDDDDEREYDNEALKEAHIVKKEYAEQRVSSVEEHYKQKQI